MKLGFVFPGQGAQFVGMGKDLYDEYEEIRSVYKEASEILGIDIAKLSFESTEEELMETKNTQICILVMSLAIAKLLETKNIKADISAGLSLGEYSALAYSDMISFKDAVKIVRARGTLMQELVPEGNWAMAAVIGLEDEKVDELCKSIKSGFVVPANYNCPGQVAVSGEKAGIDEVIKVGKDFGAKRVIELKTSGPFHTCKLEEASRRLRDELEKIDIRVTDKKVFKNIDAKEYVDGDDIRDILSKHVMSPVRFGRSIENMIDEGVDTFVEIGPGKVLSGFIKKVSKDVGGYNIQDLDSLNKFLTEIY